MDGLSKNEGARRLEIYEENMLKGKGGVSAWEVFVAQLANTLTLVLLAAMGLSFGVQDFVEGAVIAVVITLNATVRFFQEYRAEKNMDSLRQLSSPSALVRNGESMTIPAKNVVPDDAVFIEVVKTTDTFPTSAIDLPIGDRTNLCYASTILTKGRGTGIAAQARARLPVLYQASCMMADQADYGSIVCIFNIFCLDSVTDLWFVDNHVALYAIVTSIAISPESLIAVMTLTTSVGTRRMANDKTGTLTLADPTRAAELTAEANHDPLGLVGIVRNETSGDALDPSAVDEGVAQAVRIAALCDVATIRKNLKGEWKSTGDPTEVALQVFCYQAPFWPPNSYLRFDGYKDKGAEKRFELKSEFLFSSELKMTTIYTDKENMGTAFVLCQGAVEHILDSSVTYILNPAAAPTVTAPLTDAIRNVFIAKAEELASQGLRVIGMGQHACKRAGIVVCMLTRDRLTTARAIAESVEIIGPNAPKSAVMTAIEFDRLTDKEIDELLEPPLTIAHCVPETKVRMIHAGKRRRKYMSLALVGIAMGMTGSDVAKDASDLVLTDDNFDCIHVAVTEGRRLFVNIQCFIFHLLSVNIAEMVLLIVSVCFMGAQGISVFPLSSIAVLWVNMLTSSPSAFGLGLEEAPADLMKKLPHSVKDGVFSWPVIIDTFSYGIIIGITSLISFVIVIHGGNGGDLGFSCIQAAHVESCGTVFRARSTVSASLIFRILLCALESKSLGRSLFSLNPGITFYKDLLANQVLFWAVFGGMASVVLPIYIPGFSDRVFYQSGISWE
ncbi:hypothetical protein BDQ12DRAFT_700370 [Crucibulum laeve]|uniref:Cation-transporting P-type ATPase N-terminal domain-containing protein n=1 Tax=Crucibulum laeve TaxID=68775 RepID=A0A5C3LQF4_9AGAR|nr:hypothetical protein BDQ12DRAFT_700370 [Crucibulum laeve]